MGRVYQTPSPASETHLSSTNQTPRTPSGSYERLPNDETDPHGFGNAYQPHRPDELVDLPLTLTPHPHTPPVKRIRPGWHGLLYPQTPCNVVVNNKLRGSGTCVTLSDGGKREIEDFWTDDLTYRNIGSTVSPTIPGCESPSFLSGTCESPDDTQLTPVTSTEGDAELTLQLSSPNTIRRSTRLRGKVQTTEKSKSNVKNSRPSIGLPSAAVQEASPMVLTQAQPVQSPFEVAVASCVELPALYSTQWQLMYPAGGSTHPSYPWPSPDPRLTFHAHHVPLKNGLPDVSSVPNLVLPPGWHHTSWSGLHPVVFDPFHQIFKLTPVGPLPLTCEELHQGGLQNYAPGGPLHPEYGMLPTMSSLSDGSDVEVFNFDGVDWVFPWARIGGVPEVEESTIDLFSGNKPSSTGFDLLMSETPCRYVEARDCPDNVFDLQDGWRWMLNLEQVPPGTFVPTPGRKWHGTGVTRTSRKYKQPIAALMAITTGESEEDNAERYLGNQNFRIFCPFKSVATPVHIDITLLGDTEFTLVELLSFFPFHYQWRNAGERMIRAGLSALEISNFINMSRCLPGASICSQGSVDHHVFRKFKDEEPDEVTPSSTENTSYTAEGWMYDVWEITDYPLLAITHGLGELPSGVDAGPLTAIIKWVREQGKYQAMLSEVPALLREANIETLNDPSEGGDPDREVLCRHVKAMRKDHLRVLKEIKALREKKEAEGEAGTSQAAKEKGSKRRRLE